MTKLNQNTDNTKSKPKRQVDKPALGNIVNNSAIVTGGFIQSNRKILNDLKKASEEALRHSSVFTKDFTKAPSISGCGVNPISKGHDINFIKGGKGSYYFHGLQHCGSYWVCPECASKLSKYRANVVYKTVQAYKKKGYSIYFLTLTFPHYKGDNLAENLLFLTTAWDYVNAHRTVVEGLDFEYVRALEVTFGENGWHPHLHIVIVTKQPIKDYYIIRKLWLNRIETGLERKGNIHAVKLVEWDKKSRTLAKYLFDKGIEVKKEDTDKWTIAKEVTGGHIKKSKNGYTPFDMLNIMATGEAPIFDFDIEKRFVEFAETFKGKRAFSKSSMFFKNISQELEQEAEKTDEEVLKDDNVSEIIYTIEYKSWKVINKDRLKVALINAYENDQLRGVIELLHEKYQNRLVFENNTVFIDK